MGALPGFPALAAPPGGPIRCLGRKLWREVQSDGALLGRLQEIFATDRVSDASTDWIPVVVTNRVSGARADRVSNGGNDRIPDVVPTSVSDVFADRPLSRRQVGEANSDFLPPPLEGARSSAPALHPRRCSFPISSAPPPGGFLR